MKETIRVEKITVFSSHIADAIRNLAKQIGANYHEPSDDDVKEMIQNSNHTILIARNMQTNEIVGMISILIYRVPYIRKAFLEDFVVDVEHRHLGIGTKLITTAIQHCQQAGAKCVDLTSSPQRIAGNELYQKLGFIKRDTNVYRYIFDYGKK